MCGTATIYLSTLLLVCLTASLPLSHAYAPPPLPTTPKPPLPTSPNTHSTIHTPKPNPSFTLTQRHRPRRNRKSPAIRAMLRETHLQPSYFIYPLFLHEFPYSEPIPSMPNCLRHSLDSLLQEIREAITYGIRSVILFPKLEEEVKDVWGTESSNDNGLIPRAVRRIKETFPELCVICDIALDPYSVYGHDGVVNVQDGIVCNDISVGQLIQQSLCCARSGCDIVAPSDMMDGRVGAIRDALDDAGFTDVSIVAYTAKYASAYYGPFRDALNSSLSTSLPPQLFHKKSYQLDPANIREAVLEATLDDAEGADMLLVKPGVPYLDVIGKLKDVTNLPVGAYHVSGEYAMVKAACEKGWLEEKAVVLETLTCLKRAGADVIVTYCAKDAARWLCEQM